MTDKKGRGKWLTLAEHDAQLKAEGRYDAMIDRQREREAELDKRDAEYLRAEAPLVAELRGAGFAVESAWDLVNTRASYSKAIPILLAHLPRPYPGAVREGIARALALPEAKAAGWAILTRVYREDQEERAKQGLAVAVAEAADDDVIDEVIVLARDRRHGGSRGLLLSALERSKDPRARAALMSLGTDPELAEEIQVILRRLERAARRRKPATRRR